MGCIYLFIGPATYQILWKLFLAMVNIQWMFVQSKLVKLVKPGFAKLQFADWLVGQ